MILYSKSSSYWSTSARCLSRRAALAASISTSSPRGALSTNPDKSESKSDPSSSSSSDLIFFRTSSCSSLSDPSSASSSKNFLNFSVRFFFLWAYSRALRTSYFCLARMSSALIESVSDFMDLLDFAISTVGSLGSSSSLDTDSTTDSTGSEQMFSSSSQIASFSSGYSLSGT